MSRVAGRIAVGDGHDVGAESLADRGIGFDRLAKACSMRSAASAGCPSREAMRWITAASREGWLRMLLSATPASAGSLRAIASASRRSRSQIGSTMPAMAVLIGRAWFIASIP